MVAGCPDLTYSFKLFSIKYLILKLMKHLNKKIKKFLILANMLKILLIVHPYYTMRRLCIEKSKGLFSV
jgi:hypothetical protein